MTEKKKFSAIESWRTCRAAIPDGVPDASANSEEITDEIGTPDFLSAYNFLDSRGLNRYVEYIVNFSIQHPILYLLWYKWWFAYSMPKDMRKCLPNCVKQRRQQIGDRFWLEFAKHNPTLFLLLSVLCSVFQFTIRRGH